MLFRECEVTCLMTVTYVVPKRVSYCPQYIQTHLFYSAILCTRSRIILSSIFSSICLSSSHVFHVLDA